MLKQKSRRSVLQGILFLGFALFLLFAASLFVSGSVNVTAARFDSPSTISWQLAIKYTHGRTENGQ